MEKLLDDNKSISDQLTENEKKMQEF